MDFRLSEEQKMFCDAVRGFAEKHLAAGALERAHREDHPWEVAKLMAEQGLLGITIAEKDGGQGGSLDMPRIWIGALDSYAITPDPSIM